MRWLKHGAKYSTSIYLVTTKPEANEKLQTCDSSRKRKSKVWEKIEIMDSTKQSGTLDWSENRNHFIPELARSKRRCTGWKIPDIFKVVFHSMQLFDVSAWKIQTPIKRQSEKTDWGKCSLKILVIDNSASVSATIGKQCSNAVWIAPKHESAGRNH